jgi:predicted RNA-binding protein
MKLLEVDYSYSDGTYFLREVTEEQARVLTEIGGAVLRWSDEMWAEYEKFLTQERFWQQLFQYASNEAALHYEVNKLREREQTK